jgi:hypothetical protein
MGTYRDRVGGHWESDRPAVLVLAVSYGIGPMTMHELHRLAPVLLFVLEDRETLFFNEYHAIADLAPELDRLRPLTLVLCEIQGIVLLGPGLLGGEEDYGKQDRRKMIGFQGHTRIAGDKNSL